jgi:hypothetical protein
MRIARTGRTLAALRCALAACAHRRRIHRVRRRRDASGQARPPARRRRRHFALAASFFAETRVVGPVGDDFGEDGVRRPAHAAASTRTTSSTSRAARRSSGAALRARPELRHTHDRAQRLRDFEPEALAGLARGDVLFLANIQPDLQRAVREQCTAARFTALDSMNLWIDIARDSLVRTIGTVDCVILNDGEISSSRTSRTSSGPPAS